MPLTGRSDMIKECVADLAEGRSVLLVGARGMGKTAVVDAMSTHLEDGPSPVWRIAGADGASDVPFAPFAELLSRLSHATLSPLEAHARIPHELIATQATLLVDDADELDASSRVLLEHVVRAGVPVLATTSCPDGLPETVSVGTDRGVWVARPLSPLDPDSLVTIAAVALGGEPCAESVAALVSRAGGSPRVLVDLLEVASIGAVHTSAGVMLGPRLTTTDAARAWEAIRAELDPAAVVALERVAVAESVPLEVMDDLVLTVLRQQALVAVGDAVALSTPTLRDAVVDSMSAPLRRRRSAEVADLLSALGRAEDEVLAAWIAVRGGRVLDLDVAITAADRALRDGRAGRALEIVEGIADEASGDPHVALVRGAALSALERLDEAEVALSGVVPQDDELACRLCQELGLLHAVRRGQPAVAVERVGAALKSLTDGPSRAVIEGELVKWRLMAGLPGAALDQLTSSASADLQVGMVLIQAMVGSLDGPPSAAFEIVERGRQALAVSTRPARHAYELLALSELLATCFDARVRSAEDAASGRRRNALIAADPSVGLWEFVSAELALHAGRLAAAEAFARRAVIHLNWRDFTGLRAPALALHAATAARLGHAQAASQAMAALPEEALADVKVALHVARVESEGRRRARNLTDAASVLREAGERALAESHRNLGVMAFDEAWMVTPTLKLLAVLADNIEAGPLAGLAFRRAQAFHDRDIEALLAAAGEFGEAGLPGRVLHAEDLAASLLDERGHVHDARRIRSRARATRSFGELASWPQGGDEPVLTAREREIATLAAERVRSREIAARLGVSARTVDNHLGRVFRKLGIQGRDELAEALAAGGA